MQFNRPIVMSLAGMDPCAGAGLLADVKTFEQHKVYGLGIATAQTLQTDEQFFSLRWESSDDILQSIEKMLLHYPIEAVKIGIVQNIEVLNNIVSFIKSKNDTVKIIVDPVIKSSTGFGFWSNINQTTLFEMLSKIYLLTPNYNEVLQLLPSSNAKDSAHQLSSYCNVLLKGGHNNDEVGVDYLFTSNGVENLEPTTNHVYPKHGSGCVLSSAITANTALGFDLYNSCKKAKDYIEQFLTSNKSLLGYHHV